MPNTDKLAAVHDVPINEVRAFSMTAGGSALYRCGDTFYATTDICSHAYAEFNEGYLDTDDCTIECPLHGSRFDIRPAPRSRYLHMSQLRSTQYA